MQTRGCAARRICAILRLRAAAGICAHAALRSRLYQQVLERATHIAHSLGILALWRNRYLALYLKCVYAALHLVHYCTDTLISFAAWRDFSDSR